MPRFLLSLMVCALSSVSIPAHPAHADTTATTSVTQLMVLEPGDASYRLFHGAVWLEQDKATWNYRWGGLQCKGRELSDTSIQLLFAALRSTYQVTVEYVVTEYKGKSYRCITGLTIGRA
ncbi:MAG TPA: hypothetical protein VFT22_24630 [Kofleriaceae bacterium]|nr:hypothetical protein [Kofleriaceae bacterium]